jgi:hypothetical protein
MSPAFRRLALVASLAFISGQTRPALAKTSSPLDEVSWLNEIGHLCLPTPQLLYMHGSEQDQILQSLDSQLPEPDEFDIFHPDIVARHDWYQSNAERINTEAVIMPSGIEFVFNCEPYQGAVWIRWSYGRLLPVLDLRPPLENDTPFSRLWLRDIRAFSTVGSTAFSTSHFAAANPFQLNIPKRLSIYGDDLRLFEFSLPHITDEAFWYQGAGLWMTLFFRWHPADQDEIFSTPLPPSQ